MMLLVDIGNTRAKLAWLAPGDTARSTPPHSVGYADLAEFIRQSRPVPQRILGSNVAGEAIAHALEQACRQHWHLEVQWCDARDGQDLLHNPYAQPRQLGADRWLGMLGLLQRIRHEPDWQAGAPCMLASFGTATTIDTLLHSSPAKEGPEARFLGGLILPGVTLMAHSLTDGTARLPLAGGLSTDFPTDTHAAITSGIVAAQGGALLRQWRLAQQHGYPPPRIFVTGGGWPAVSTDLCQALTQAQADLHRPLQAPEWLDAPVLDGLACLGRRNSLPQAVP